MWVVTQRITTKVSTHPSSGSGSDLGSSVGSYSGSSRTPTRVLDPAIAAIDKAVEIVRYDGLGPAELSAAVAGIRELFWHTTTLTSALNGAYSRLSGLGHDHGHDPAVSANVIVEQLANVTAGLTVIDQALGDVHDHAAHLYRL